MTSSVNGTWNSDEKLRILLVEDHADTALMMGRLLELQGYEVATATSVTSAIELAGKTHFDLLISDIGLPDGSGLDLMRNLKELGPLRGIALSGFGMLRDADRSREAGFAVHLIKPIDFKELQLAIERVMGGGNRQSES